MAGSKTGTPTIIRLVRKICKLVAVYGAGNLGSSTTPEFAAAVVTLVAACHAFEALDDFPAQIDTTSPFGPEDLPPA
jgi:hypothetical protein